MLQILCIVTGGNNDGNRARRLLSSLPAEVTYYDVDQSRPRRESFREIRDQLRARTWDLVFQEGTGIVGGLNLILAAATRGQKYVLSSGDPIAGFFRTTKGPLYGAVFSLYERLLYRFCTAFVGWTPYLAGLSLQLGAPRSVTIEGAIDPSDFFPYDVDRQQGLRADYGIPSDHLVCGMVGSLHWSPRQQYCYGLELVEMLRHLKRDDVTILIVGDGDGRARLEKRVPPALQSRVVFTGRVPPSTVVDTMNVMDIGFITQTVDGLGSYRLTTKLPEYLACGVPVAMSPIPGFFDYAFEAGWALPDAHPATAAFHRDCAAWIDALTHAEIQEKARRARPIAERRFQYDLVVERFRTFMADLIDFPPASSSNASQYRAGHASLPAAPEAG
jgi:glycosyltransferase involved in cell wall biosynthesis